MANSLKDK